MSTDVLETHQYPGAGGAGEGRKYWTKSASSLEQVEFRQLSFTRYSPLRALRCVRFRLLLFTLDPPLKRTRSPTRNSAADSAHRFVESHRRCERLREVGETEMARTPKPDCIELARLPSHRRRDRRIR